jgi:hypothetical protein
LALLGLGGLPFDGEKELYSPVRLVHKKLMTMQQSPYDAPQSTMMPQPPPDLVMERIIEPPSIKVFGIFHLVVAGLGIIGTIAGLVMMQFTDQFSKMMTIAPPGSTATGSSPQELAMRQYMNDTRTYSYITYVFAIVLAVMLIIAGIGLLKRRESGRVMSIRYAWTSIGMKVITLLIMLTFMIPATTRYNEAMFSGMGSGMGSTMNIVTQATQFLSLLVTCIYPIVVLIMMRKEKVKTFLAGQAR